VLYQAETISAAQRLDLKGKRRANSRPILTAFARCIDNSPDGAVTVTMVRTVFATMKVNTRGRRRGRSRSTHVHCVVERGIDARRARQPGHLPEAGRKVPTT
jgi:hypothetical protein